MPDIPSKHLESWLAIASSPYNGRLKDFTQYYPDHFQFNPSAHAFWQNIWSQNGKPVTSETLANFVYIEDPEFRKQIQQWMRGGHVFVVEEVHFDDLFQNIWLLSLLSLNNIILHRGLSLGEAGSGNVPQRIQESLAVNYWLNMIPQVSPAVPDGKLAAYHPLIHQAIETRLNETVPHHLQRLWLQEATFPGLEAWKQRIHANLVDHPNADQHEVFHKLLCQPDGIITLDGSERKKDVEYPHKDHPIPLHIYKNLRPDTPIVQMLSKGAGVLILDPRIVDADLMIFALYWSQLYDVNRRKLENPLRHTTLLPNHCNGSEIMR